MWRTLRRLGVWLVLVCISSPAFAHFQMLYVEQSALLRGGAMHLAFIFTHPFAGGPNMEMGQPEAFYLIHQRGDDGTPVRTDLREYR